MVRDPELMIEILEEIAERPEGYILEVATLGMSPAQSAKLHHLRLLADAGLVDQMNDHAHRITNDGYDFLGAVKQDRPKYTKIFKNLLDQGKSLLSASNQIVTLVDAVS